MKNRVDFYLRNLFRFSRKGYQEKTENKEGLFSGKIRIKEDRLLRQYRLEKFKENSSVSNYCENLFMLELLDDYLRPKRKKSLKVLDIGAKNWSYVKAQHSFFRRFTTPKNLIIDGIELDAYRVYSNFYSRYDAAKYNTEGLLGANYIVGDFMEHIGKYDYIIWILPFVSNYPHRMWGLPKKFFRPKEMLEKAFNDLTEDGVMLIANQDEDEYILQQELFDELEIPYMPCGKFKCSFFEYKYPRYVSIVTRNGRLHL